MPDEIGGAEGLQPSQQELGNKPPQNTEKVPSGEVRAITTKIGFFHNNPDHALRAIAGTPPEQSPIAADPTVQGEKKRRAGFTSPDLGPPIPAGAGEPTQDNPGGQPETKKTESGGKQKTEWTDEDIEFLAPARKEYQANMGELTKNLAQLDSSGVNPEQGGPATREKWGRIKEFFKSDTGKNITFLSGVALVSAGVGAAVVGGAFLPALGIAGGVSGGIYLYDLIERKVTKWRNQGQQESKSIPTGVNQEAKPK